MAGNGGFDLIQDGGWRAGLNNLLRAELGRWWNTSTWWTQSLIWIVVIDLLLMIVILGQRSEGSEAPAEEVLTLYGVFGGLFVMIGGIVLMQGALVGEKAAGTAAWVLSKPVSRTAFVLSKLVANALGMAVTAILIPGVIAFFVLNMIGQIEVSVVDLLAGMGVFFLSTSFWLAFTLMLGSFFGSRGPVIGIPLAMILGQQFITGLLPWLAFILPFQLVIPGAEGGSVVSDVIGGSVPASWVPVYMSVVLIVLLTAIAVWRFGREEL